MSPSNSNLPATTGEAKSSTSSLNRTQSFRPKSSPKANAQELCLLVLDASGSMAGTADGGQTKADAVNEAARGLINRLNASSKRANFHVGVINFDTRTVIRQAAIPISTVSLSVSVLEMSDLGHATNIGNALETAYEMSIDFLSREQPGGLKHNVVIMVLSDGLCHRSDLTRQIAGRIKETHRINKLKIATVLFQGLADDDDDEESAAASDLLREIASTKLSGEVCFTKTKNPETLRQFLIASSGVDQQS